MSDKVLDKIKKCLALSKSDNAHEAATALRQAQALMEKHNVSADDVSLSEVNAEHVKVGTTQTLPVYQQMLVNMLNNALGVEAILRWCPFGGSSIKFIGFGSQPEIAAYVYGVLLRQLKRDRANYLKTLSNRYKKKGKTRKADIFAEQWVAAVASKAAEFNLSTKEKGLIKQYQEQKHGELETMKRKTHKMSNNDLDAINAGHNAADGVTLHHGVGGAAERNLLV